MLCEQARIVGTALLPMATERRSKYEWGAELVADSGESFRVNVRLTSYVEVINARGVRVEGPPHARPEPGAQAYHRRLVSLPLLFDRPRRRAGSLAGPIPNSLLDAEDWAGSIDSGCQGRHQSTATGVRLEALYLDTGASPLGLHGLPGGVFVNVKVPTEPWGLNASIRKVWLHRRALRGVPVSYHCPARRWTFAGRWSRCARRSTTSLETDPYLR